MWNTVFLEMNIISSCSNTSKIILWEHITKKLRSDILMALYTAFCSSHIFLIFVRICQSSEPIKYQHMVSFVCWYWCLPVVCQVHIWKQTLTGQWLETFPFIVPEPRCQMEQSGKRRHPRNNLPTCFASRHVPIVAYRRTGTHKFPAVVAGVRRKYPNWLEVGIQHTEAILRSQCLHHHNQDSSSSGIDRAVNSQGLVRLRRGTHPGDRAVMKMFSIHVR